MRSGIKVLADYTQAEFLREIDVRCPEEYMQKNVQAVTRSGKRSETVSVLEKGDAAVLTLVSELPRFNRPVVPVAVGSGMYDKELEEQLLGRAVGETFTAQVQGTPVTVTVKQATRVVFPELTDELVAEYAASQGRMEGVKTVADFRRWVEEQYREEMRQDAVYRGMRACRDYVMAHSQWEFDEAELSDMIGSYRDSQRETMKQKWGLDYDTASDEDFQRSCGMSRQEQERQFRQWSERDLATFLWFAGAQGMDPAQADQEELRRSGWDFMEKYVSSQITFIN